MTYPNGYRWRKIKSGTAVTFALVCVLLALAPLFMIFFYTLF
jgi:hypothetical protein